MQNYSYPTNNWVEQEELITKKNGKLLLIDWIPNFITQPVSRNTKYLYQNFGQKMNFYINI